MSDLEPVALALDAAYRNATFIEAPSRTLPQFSHAQALAVAERGRALRIAGGDEPAGYKVGFTNAAVREQFGAAGRIAATVYRQTLLPVPQVDTGRLLGPRIEPEIVVGIGADGGIAWAALGFEIVQSHVADWRIGYLDTIADFGLHAALVIGERRTLGAADVERLSTMRVELRRDGVVVERGSGGDVDGGPLGSVAWLRAALQPTGRRLLPGEIVSTGSMTRVPSIAPGESWTIAALDNEFAPLTIATF